MAAIQELLTDDFFKEGVYLFLGASDTGKTTLVWQLAAQLAMKEQTAIVDADTGQSHIGPPATVGWAIAKAGENDLRKLPVGGIAFAGEISPIGHLLQLTGAIVNCVEQALRLCSPANALPGQARQASRKAGTLLIDTPGFVSGSAACALWWEVVRIIRPKGIIAVERGNELSDIIQGLKHSGPVIEEIKCSESVSQKSPEHRRAYRQQRFAEYFADAKVYETGLKEISVQAGRRLDGDNTKGLLVGLRDNKGIDIAMGFVVEWHEGDKVIFKSPEINLNQICCIVVGDATVDLPE